MTDDIWNRHAARDEARSPWRFYPIATAGALFLVFLVNAGMVWSALATFPGAAKENGFDESNVYNSVMAAAAQQKALGWQVKTALQNGRLLITLHDRTGAALNGARIDAEAERPLGVKNTTALGFLPAGDGLYLANAALPLSGQWDLALHITQGQEQVRLTRRVLAP